MDSSQQEMSKPAKLDVSARRADLYIGKVKGPLAVGQEATKRNRCMAEPGTKGNRRTKLDVSTAIAQELPHATFSPETQGTAKPGQKENF